MDMGEFLKEIIKKSLVSDNMCFCIANCENLETKEYRNYIVYDNKITVYKSKIKKAVDELSNKINNDNRYYDRSQLKCIINILMNITTYSPQNIYYFIKDDILLLYTGEYIAVLTPCYVR